MLGLEHARQRLTAALADHNDDLAFAGLVLGKTTVDAILFGILAYADVVPATLGMVSFWQCTGKKAVAAYLRDLELTGTGAGTAFAYRGGKSYDGDFILDRGATVVDDVGGEGKLIDLESWVSHLLTHALGPMGSS